MQNNIKWATCYKDNINPEKSKASLGTGDTQGSEPASAWGSADSQGLPTPSQGSPASKFALCHPVNQAFPATPQLLPSLCILALVSLHPHRNTNKPFHVWSTAVSPVPSSVLYLVGTRSSYYMTTYYAASLCQTSKILDFFFFSEKRVELKISTPKNGSCEVIDT